MNQYKNKFLTYLVLASLIFSDLGTSLTYINSTYASNDIGNKKTEVIQDKRIGNKKSDIVLKDKYSSKKLDRIKKSVKGEKGYKLLIKSNDSIDKINNFFVSGDKKIKVKKVGDSEYMIKLPLNSKSFNTELSKVDSGIIPATLGDYNVVAPQIIDISSDDSTGSIASSTGSNNSNSYLSGEEIDKLWGIKKVGADSFQEELKTKDKIKVGILDTGIDSNNDDLKDNYDVSLSYDFINNTSGGIDDNGHGTQVAGVIGSEVNGKGIFGVNSNTDLVSLKVLNEDGIGTTYDILEAIDYAKTNNIKVINMSFGGSSDPTDNPVCSAITDAKNNGIITVVAAGNTNSQVSNIIPAGCSDAITVGATKEDNTRAEFSNYGDKVSVYAPGVNIYTTTLNNTYTTINGTSFSAPLVTGLVAKEIAYSPSIGYDQILQNIKSNYNLLTNSTITNNTTNNTSSGSITGIGTTGIGSSMSGVVLPAIDYSTYKYYSGTFMQDGKTYGNSLYSTEYQFSEPNLKNVQIYTYDEYIKLARSSSNGTFKTLSIPTDGLIGKWDFDGNGNDSSGNGNNGNIIGSSYVEGINGSALFLNNSNNSGRFDKKDYVILPNTTISNFSVSLWTKMFMANNFDEGAAIFSCGDGTSGMFSLNAHSNQGLVSGNIYNGSANYGTEYFQISDGLWHNLVLTKGGGYLKLYIDGILKSSIYMSTDINFTNCPAYLGYHQWYGGGAGSSRYYGLLDNVLTYQGVLNDSQIQSLYHEGTTQINTSTNYPIFNLTPFGLSAYNGPIYNTVQNNNKVVSSDKKSVKINEKNAGDPVNLSNGEFTYNNTLMSIPGVKIPYEFSIDYRNQTTYDGPVGNKFDHNYNMFLSENEDSSVNFYNGKLGLFNFTPSGGTFAYNEGLKANLSKTNGLYTITYDNGNKYYFGDNLKLSKLEDTYGNNLTFTYNTDKQLNTVTDTLGRAISYTYYDNSRLKRVTDFNGRYVELVYYAGETGGSIGDLKTISIVNGSSTKTISFEYDGSSDITKLYDAKGQLYVTNVYDTNKRVTSQTYGNGTITYAYTLATDGTVETNTVTNRSGVVTKYTYDSYGNTTKREVYDKVGTGKTETNYEYDSNHRLFKEKQPKGDGTTYIYDSRGNITEKRKKISINADDSSEDIVTSYEYNQIYDIPVKIILPNGLETSYTLDSSGNITGETATGITDNSSNTYSKNISYEYNTNGLVKKKTDPEGSITNYEYGLGQVIKSIKGAGANTIEEDYSYNDYGNILSSTDGEGKTSSFSYNDFNLLTSSTSPEGIVSNYYYDANNNKTKDEIVLSGSLSTTEYEYDSLDHLIKKTVNIDGTSTRSINMIYDNDEQLLHTRELNGVSTGNKYNEMGLLTEKRIVTSMFFPDTDIVTTYTYDRNGNVITVTDPEGNITIYDYDGFDRVFKKTNADNTFDIFGYNKMGKVVIDFKYNATGTLVSKIGYSYDELGNIIRSTIYKLEDSSTIISSVKYNKNGQLVESIDPKGNITTNTYDIFGRLSETQDALGNKTQNSYDKRNLVTKKEIIGSGSIGTYTNYEYNNDGRLKKEIDAKGNYKQYAYNNLNKVIGIRDENGNITQNTYDNIGELLAETKIIVGSGSNINSTTSYSYDTHGNPISLTDANGNITRYEYDTLGRKTKQIYPDNSFTIYSYSKNNNLLSLTDPNGTVITNTYDTLNRLTEKNIALGNGVVGITKENYYYDSLGRLSSTIDSNGNNLGFSYNSIGQLISENNSGSLVNYSYDLNGNRTNITMSGIYDTDYNYDNLNRLANVSYNNSNISNFSFTGILLDSISNSNSTKTTRAYDELLRLTNLNNSNILTSNIIRDYSYSYDDVGNITSDSVKNYVYDSLYRLIGVSNSGTTLESYDYDNIGNRTSDLTNSYSGNILNQYTSISGTTLSGSYIYDNNGNLTQDNRYKYSYDYKNRLVEVKKVGDNSLVAVYSYDVLGRRISKTTSTNQIKYIYAGDNAILEVNKNLGSNNITSKSLIYGNEIDNLLAYEYDDNNFTEFDSEHYAFCYSRVIPYSLEFNKFGYVGVVNSCNNLENKYNTTTKKLFFIHTNNLGSTIALTDSSGSIVLSYDYDSYGNTYVLNSSGTYVSIDDYKGNLRGNDRLYTGREYDSETNLYFYRARYYSPELGRFISRDPIDTEDDINLYSYVGDNPVNGVDPTGMYECNVKKIVNKVYDYGSNIKDVYDLIQNNINRLKFTAGTALALGGGTVAGVTGPTCIATTTVSGGCAILATPTGPGMLVCTVPAIGMGISCGTAAVGTAVAGLGSYMMSTSNGGVDSNSNKNVGDMIPGRLKKSSSYHSSYAKLTVEELYNLVKQGDQKAKQMKKLLENIPRLMQKIN